MATIATLFGANNSNKGQVLSNIKRVMVQNNKSFYQIQTEKTFYNQIQTEKTLKSNVLFLHFSGDSSNTNVLFSTF